MQKWGYDPLEVIVQAAQDPNTSQDTKLEIATVLLPYMYPRLSSIEVQAEVEVSDKNRPDQGELMRRILANPELADAAQRLALEASSVLLLEGQAEDLGSEAIN